LLILTNGKVWTGDGFVDGVAIEGNRIVAVGSGMSGIDLRGRLVVPGFIDNHTHFIDGGMQLSRVQLRDATTPEEFARRIAAHGEAWITGGGWDQTIWSPPALPTRALVDHIDRPVFVSRLDMHMALANSVALRLAGITRHTPDPPGGTIVREADGEPTGILKDAAMKLVPVPPATTAERVAAARAALAEAARFGVTSLCDMSGAAAEDDWRAYQQVEMTARVPPAAPILGGGRPGPPPPGVSPGGELRSGETPERRGRDARTPGLKGFADGSLGSSTAAFFEPYADDPSNRGLLMVDERMRSAIAAADGLQVAIHAIGDRANDEVLKIFESMPRGRRYRIEHAQHLNPSLIRRFADAGVIASMQPYHAVEDGPWMEGKIGPERMRWAYPFRELLDAGVTVTFGSDWTVAPLNPLLGVSAAVSRGVTVTEALRCYTVNNAYAMFREHDIGRIAPGMMADIVVLSNDLFTIAPEKIAEVEVDFTIFDGQTIYERRN
jgi:predicted amidohydrolase YtcJ